MLRPACEYGFHPLQVSDVEFPWGVVMLDSFNAKSADFLDEVYSVGDQVS